MKVLDYEQIRLIIDESNRSAALNNRNLYPIQEQATLVEIWEYVPFYCKGDCSCSAFKRKYNWKLKNSLKYEEILVAYLRMFVDSPKHKTVVDMIYEPDIDCRRLPSRIGGAVSSMKYLKDYWDVLYSHALVNNKTLICDDWCDEFWRRELSFPIFESVYRAKLYSILLPNICVPYDSASRTKIKTYLQIRDNCSYREMLQRMSIKVREIIDNDKSDLAAFQRLDIPAKALKFNPNQISLKRKDINYGQDYLPLERPISRIVDKMFYKPTQ